ncbi:MAG: helix-turn-helix domain-containing protein [Sediminibacterium sp.]|nr:helix-turn-helix domain-containing protein [Sediminibacterium sp.]
MSQAGKNLKFLRKKIKLTQEEFALRMGLKRSLLGSYEEERAKPHLSLVKKICTYFDISFEDFLLKDLSNLVYDNSLSESKSQSFTQKRLTEKLLNARNNISFVPIKAAAGYLAGFSDETFIDELNTFTLPMLASGNYRAFEIEGDSMMPTPSGSVIVGEKINSFSDIKNANTYIFVIKNQGVVYKRVLITDKKNTLTLQSDNPIFEPYSIKTNEIVELWKTTLIIQKPETKMPLWNVNSLANAVQDMQAQMKSMNKKIK